MKRLKYYENSVPLRIRLVSSLIFPFFDYCAAVLTDLTGQQKLELKRLTNACLRFVFNLRRDERVSHFYDVLGWLSADDRRTYRWVLPATSVLASILATTRAPLHSISLFPSAGPLTYQRSLYYVGVTMWNSLLVTIREFSTLNLNEDSSLICGSMRPTYPSNHRDPRYGTA